MQKMSKLITCILMLTGLETEAQILNGSFEDTLVVQSSWSTNIFDTVPEHWSVTDFSGYELSSDAFSGNFAAQIYLWYNSNGAGILHYGNYTGMPIDFRPTALTGYYKLSEGNYMNGLLDSTRAEIVLTKYDVDLNEKDTLGYGELLFGEASSYTFFTIPVVYSSSEMPDTVEITFEPFSELFPNCVGDINGHCNVFTIDNLNIIGQPTGITNQPQSEIRVGPNPFDNIITIEAGENENLAFRILDNLGRIHLTGKIHTKRNIDASTLSPNFYILQIFREGELIMNRKILKYGR